MTFRDLLAMASDFATVVTSVTAILFAVWSYRRTVQQAKLQNSSVLVNTLKQQFESSECRESRRRLASELLAAHEAKHGSSHRPKLERDSYLVLEIFEQIGYLVRREVLDEGIVWSVFAWDVIRYAEALKQSTDQDLLQAARRRCEQPTLFSDFESLAARLRAIGIREHRGRRDTYNWAELKEYLEAECGGISVYEEPPHSPGQESGNSLSSDQRQP